ncbi:PREDICTED: probable phospholipid-transporting ATPase IK [Elephantulus edwardii]|uniref:probable phospholipid-transporting ATPase IK n=1 Tax=Elephantulus edwardii TaxID=28737 RepID=UPI0003F0D086|nr:PREDICTED: probable phospholipid-transporting ATPase IK [Elephantulus edwardii]
MPRPSQSPENSASPSCRGCCSREARTTTLLPPSPPPPSWVLILCPLAPPPIQARPSVEIRPPPPWPRPQGRPVSNPGLIPSLGPPLHVDPPPALAPPSAETRLRPGPAPTPTPCAFHRSTPGQQPHQRGRPGHLRPSPACAGEPRPACRCAASGPAHLLWALLGLSWLPRPWGLWEVPWALREDRRFSSTWMASLSYQDVFREDENSEFTWEVKANNPHYHGQFKEKVFLCCKRNKYKNNIIRTTKYNLFTFLPLNLFEQFHRVSNLYFLLIIILQSIPEISTLPWFILFTPLVCLLVIRAVRDLVDDIGRHRSDTAINNRPCQVLVRKRFLWRKWKDLCVGDVVCLHKDSIVPADMLLLASTEPSSLCYVETADIDGETNLKFRQALSITHHELTTVRSMSTFQGKVVCEKPNSRMHTFVGRLEWKGEKYPLNSGNILLRGFKIRNTHTCYGLVIYAGFDTKIMKNCGKIQMKRTKLDHLMNKLVILIFLFLVLAALALTVGFRYKMEEFVSKHHYLWGSYQSVTSCDSVLNFLGFLILLSVMLPMAMFIIAEFIYLGNSVFINWDKEMYYEPTDMPAKARSTSLNDHLGQVEFVFSDKTGTLTQNIMAFKKCCIDGYIYGGPPCPTRPQPASQPSTPRHRAQAPTAAPREGLGAGLQDSEGPGELSLTLSPPPPGSEDKDTDSEDNPYQWNKYADRKLLFHNAALLATVRADESPAMREFWRLLALCHTVMVQEQDNQLLYQAASPDEEALVTAARNFGYVFLSRTQDTITLMELGQTRVYQVLAMMDFNSVRKRMSVLVRNPEGSIILYTKGADTVIFERLSKRDLTEKATEGALAAFAEETLRTLCLAYKEVDEGEYKEWSQRHMDASLLLHSRAQALHQVYEEMELDLQLLGATAIEDRLQDGVPDTISCLKKGNIKVWVLTGDKKETAVNIAFACRLLSEDMIILEESEVMSMLQNYWESNNNLQDEQNRGLSHAKMAMVISGDFLDQVITQTEVDKSHNTSWTLSSIVPHGDVWREPEQGARPPLPPFLARAWCSVSAWLGCTWGPRWSREAESREGSEVRWERAFVDLAVCCQAVICYRVTPKQKASIVTMVKKHKKVVTLAIGDGANDVNMIKTADIGVGLAGQEGMQAVQNSDYVVAQFSFLKRLLLVHGRWSYLRICKFLRYFIFKTPASMMAQTWYAFFNGFTAQPIYEGWFLAFFNLLYSTLPVLYIGLFEQDVSAERSLQRPELYTAGQKDELFNYSVFFQALGHGLLTSLINFFVTLLACYNTGGTHSLSDYQSFGVILALSALLSITVEVMLVIRYWTVLTVVSIFLSFSSYVVVTFATQSLWLFKISPFTYPFLYADHNVLSQPFAHLVILLNVTTNTLLVLAFRVIHKIVTKLHTKGEEEFPSQEMTVEPVPHLQRETRTRRSSYAFSHREGYADLITQGTILRKSDENHSELMGEDQDLYENEMPLNAGDPTRIHRRLLKWKHQSTGKFSCPSVGSMPKHQGTDPEPSEMPMSLAEAPSPPTEDSDRTEQPMEVEPWPSASQSSSMEWLPATTEDETQPAGTKLQ